MKGAPCNFPNSTLNNNMRSILALLLSTSLLATAAPQIKVTETYKNQKI